MREHPELKRGTIFIQNYFQSKQDCLDECHTTTTQNCEIQNYLTTGNGGCAPYVGKLESFGCYPADENECKTASESRRSCTFEHFQNYKSISNQNRILIKGQFGTYEPVEIEVLNIFL